MSTDTAKGTLPKGWRQLALKDACELITDGSHFSPTTVEKGIPYITVRDLGDSGIDFLHCKFITRESFVELARNGCQPFKNDVLFSKDGTVGKVALVNDDQEFVVLSSLAIVRPNKETVSSAFLKLSMQSPSFLETALGLKTGTALRRIVLRNLKTVSVAVPPLLEQEKIVEILEEQLSRLDAALVSVRTVREKTARFRRSLMHAAFTGALTGHDISTGGHPEGWMIKDLRELVDVLDSIRKPINSEERLDRTGTVPYFGASGQVGTIDKALFDEDLVLLGEDGVQFFDVDKHKAYEISGPSWVNNHAHVLRCKKEKYIQHLLVCYLNQFDYRNYANGTTRLKLTQAAMNRIPVIVPPLKEQEKIVGILKEQFARLDSSLAIADAIERKSSAMRRSLLHAAFTGELTKVWREGAHV
jgi:restriction endonuclease S subunit